MGLPATRRDLHLQSPGWRSGPVDLASSHRLRLRGLRPRPDGRGLLIRTRSVHGLGMREEVSIVGLGADGSVYRVGVLRPRGLAVMVQCRWILELPIAEPLPTVGDGVMVFAGPATTVGGA